MNCIRDIHVFPLRIPMIRGFSFASGSAGEAGGWAPHVLVKIIDDEGCYGWGEARPVAQWSYETLETVTSTLRRYLIPAVLGLEVHDRRGLHERMNSCIGRGPSTGQPIAKAAVDVALHDLIARRLQIPLRTFLGGSSEKCSVDLSYTLASTDHDELERDIETGLQSGFVHANFKCGVHAEKDIRTAETIRTRLTDDSFLWADANQGYKLHQARRCASEFASIGISVLEQPFPADQRRLMRALRASTRLPLAIDESCVSVADYFEYVSQSLVDYLVIKVTRSGGIWPSVGQIRVAEAAGIPLLVSGLADGLLTKLASCQTAAAFGFYGPAALNGSQFIDESILYPDKPNIENRGSVLLDESVGIGVEPDEAGIRELLMADL